MRNTFETYLPIFSGFYGGYFEIDESQIIADIQFDRVENGKNELAEISLEIDYSQYYQEISIKLCKEIQYLIRENIDENCDITFQKITSPKYYNFTNDSIDISIEIDLEKILSLIEENFERFTQYIKENYTNRSGFISGFTNDANEWIKADFIENHSSHCIGTFLDFLLKDVYEVEECNIANYVLEDVYENQFCTNYTELCELDVYSEYSLDFENENDFDACLTFLNTWYHTIDIKFDREFLKVSFIEEIEKSLLNDLENSNLINFNFKLVK
jgi:hypothetical protein